ncbi:Utp14 protein-domain-containing protein [Podospora aff. communis PSN243]|uniref:Utp14 protein-domain-containing protein n=1 Tax=Podospora aff. communis PSN243 TaxID=3040156 RepID=A0AAV9H235_9PEZI|nr:Utp14 protein-domain-containing protein [Podospora aff. communis PSN243]
MPGRQAHGRSLLPASGAKKERKPSSRSRANKALDAFALAEKEVPTRRSKGVRMRDLDEEPAERSQKRQHEDDDEDDEDGEEMDERPQKKKARKGDDDEFEGFSGGSDEEEWHVGVGSGDEDSEIDSDEAFGESDEEKFEGYGFRGGKLKKSKADEEEEDDEDLESLGSDAIDLATALDQWSEGDDDIEEEDGSGSEEEEEASSDDSSDSDDEEDPSKIGSLQKMISGFAGDSDEEEEDTGPKQKAKVSLEDLGLAGVKDRHIKKSLKLMNKEEKATKSGSSKKLAVPLARRHQDKLDRAAAYEKTTETLDRWIDTVKQNRRAEHLVFPLAQNAHNAGLDNGELLPVTAKTAGTELEQTILAIMEESGLGQSAKARQVREENAAAEGQEGPTMAEQIEAARQRRKERELHSREAARAKRIKKIKSKAYRRIHRKEALREEQANHEALAAAGELDSDGEREAQDRRRALERVGTRHRESKWAKLGKKAGRAVWDDDFRAGLNEMAQRKDDLKRRIEGRTKGSGDEDEDMSDDSGDSDDGAGRRGLLKQLDRAAAYEEDEPQSGLMAMKFMQRGEALRKKENDDLVDQIRRDLDSEAESEEAEETDLGRRRFGMGQTAPKTNPFLPKSKKDGGDGVSKSAAKSTDAPMNLSLPEREPSPAAPGAAGAWSRAGKDGHKSTKAPKGRVDELDLSNAAMLATKKSTKPPKSKPEAEASTDVQVQEDSDDETAIHLPMAIRDQELIKRAFAGEDVVGEFEKEKAEIAQEDDEKEIDNTLPGWGGWVGEGVSSREMKRHTGRFITKVDGVKQKDRKDFKLKGVIVSERTIKKNNKYLAPQLPHPFESQQQYERSLRLPIGPEWGTKETFQSATKPRVIVKQGIIAPMSKPMV